MPLGNGKKRIIARCPYRQMGMNESQGPKREGVRGANL
jgi:hypothetical protein